MQDTWVKTVRMEELHLARPRTRFQTNEDTEQTIYIHPPMDGHS